MSLKKIAASMHVEAMKKGRSFRRLRGGLCLTLYYRPSPKDDIVLKLARPNVQPSDTEVEVCQSNFFFGYPLTNKATKGNTVYIAVEGVVERIARTLKIVFTGRRLNAVFLKKVRCVVCCSQCNSTKLVENHHVIPRADGGALKTIPLCRSCHLRLHGINGDFRRWTSAWHQYYREVDPEGYREHQRNAGRARQAQLRRLLGENGYSAYQRRLVMIRWTNGQA